MPTVVNKLLSNLLATSRFELMAMSHIEPVMLHLPRNAKVRIVTSPTRGNHVDKITGVHLYTFSTLESTEA